MTIDTRQSDILRLVVREYVRSARPVSSEAVGRKYRMRISPATIRNEFAELTADGYLRQPHTSAGRIPTNRGYRRYLDSGAIGTRRLPADAIKTVAEDLAEHAEMLAHVSGLLAAIWHEKDELAVKGFRQILDQPEFTEHGASVRLAELLDILPRTLARFFSLDEPAGVFIGEECPFWANEDISVVFRRIRFPDRACGIRCIIGPTRMSYETNWELLE